MPKIKTHRGAAKRFKKTGSGKISRRRACKSHMMTGKPAKRTRRLRTSALISAGEQKSISRLLPYL
jgi:large subunit ribosomal protein L35